MDFLLTRGGWVLSTLTRQGIIPRGVTTVTCRTKIENIFVTYWLMPMFIGSNYEEKKP